MSRTAKGWQSAFHPRELSKHHSGPDDEPVSIGPYVRYVKSQTSAGLAHNRRLRR